MFACTQFTPFSIFARLASMSAGASALGRLLLLLPTGCRA
jgi:hypothetical protein